MEIVLHLVVLALYRASLPHTVYRLPRGKNTMDSRTSLVQCCSLMVRSTSPALTWYGFPVWHKEVTGFFAWAGFRASSDLVSVIQAGHRCGEARRPLTKLTLHEVFCDEGEGGREGQNNNYLGAPLPESLKSSMVQQERGNRLTGS